eukprot:1156699-Pelagomonas_calceolata.AAC.3
MYATPVPNAHLFFKAKPRIASYWQSCFVLWLPEMQDLIQPSGPILQNVALLCGISLLTPHTEKVNR